MILIDARHPPVFAALRAAGLDDDAARLTAWFQGAGQDLAALERARLVLEVGGENLRVVVRDLEALAESVRALRSVPWHSVAGRCYADVAEQMFRESRGVVDSAQEWVAVWATAAREAEDARRAAEQRARAVEDAALAVLQAGAGA